MGTHRGRLVTLLVVAGGVRGSGLSGTAAAASPGLSPSAPDLGSNVLVLNPSMPQATIQSELNAIATQQVPNQFGQQRYAILFEPGTYGSASDPLIFQVGYYTQVAGLGAQPGDVVINGAIDVFNSGSDCATATCDGLDNFWRSLSNLTLNVTLPSTAPTYVPDNGENAGCKNADEMWAVSQAAPIRRVIMNGPITLQDFCNEGFVSGGFLADDEFNGSSVLNAGQQQFFTRNSDIDSWTNGVWNQVFLGDNALATTARRPPASARQARLFSGPACQCWNDRGPTLRELPADRRCPAESAWYTLGERRGSRWVVIRRVHSTGRPFGRGSGILVMRIQRCEHNQS